MTKKTRRAKARRALLALCLVLVTMMFTVGGTIAWLTAQTDPVENVFTTSTIGVALNETTTAYPMVPGHTVAKDPKVTVDANSEDSYVFVKVVYTPGSFTDEDGTTHTYDALDYAIEDGWTQLTDANGVAVADVYYRTWTKGSADTVFYVLKDNTVTVSEDLTKEQMNAMTAANGTKPTIKVQAFVCQYYETNDEAFEAYEAWQKVAGTAQI